MSARWKTPIPPHWKHPSLPIPSFIRSCVREKGKGKYEVIAGRRRFLAFERLIAAKKLTKDFPIKVTLLPETLIAGEVSLAENVERERCIRSMSSRPSENSLRTRAKPARRSPSASVCRCCTSTAASSSPRSRQKS